MLPTVDFCYLARFTSPAIGRMSWDTRRWVFVLVLDHFPLPPLLGFVYSDWLQHSYPVIHCTEWTLERHVAHGVAQLLTTLVAHRLNFPGGWSVRRFQVGSNSFALQTRQITSVSSSAALGTNPVSSSPYRSRMTLGDNALLMRDPIGLALEFVSRNTSIEGRGSGLHRFPILDHFVFVSSATSLSCVPGCAQ